MVTKTALPSIPSALTSVALIDAPTCAAAGGMSVSWWHEEVRAKRAPAAAVKQPRCSRWRLADVSAFWLAFASNGESNTKAAEQVTALAKKASDAAKKWRVAAGRGAAA